mgnify:FL=1
MHLRARAKPPDALRKCLDMNIHETEERLEAKGIKPTANRILVLKALDEAGRPASLADLEAQIESMDKSSVFRTLTLFLEKDIVHSFEDGRGVINYELCTEEGHCDHSDAHIHFYCERCHRSYCMEHINLDRVPVPEGFEPHAYSFVIKGICPHCR